MKEYDLVFEGGGAKGSVFVGALKVFFDNECKPRRFLGTSAGAITATLMAAGFEPDEMLDAVNEKLENGKPRFSSFMDIPNEFSEATINNSFIYAIFEKIDFHLPDFFQKKIDSSIFDQLNKLKAFRGVFSFIERGGVYSGETFVQWLEEQLNKKDRGYGNMTLKEFNKETGRDLSLVITDTKDQIMRVLNHRTAPDCPVKYAVRMSMSIPFVWQEVLWKQEWGQYLGADITGNTIVDGGVLSNFPIDLMNTNQPEIMGDDVDVDGADTLGFLIDETLKVVGAEDRIVNVDNGNEDLETRGHRVIHRIKRLIDTMTGAHDQASMIKYQEQVCRLPAKGYGTTEFDMTDERLDALIAAGRKAMQEYFNTHPPQ